MSRGRIAENNEVLDKWVLKSTDYTGETTIIKFDRKKSPNGPYRIETILPKGTRLSKPIIDKNQKYTPHPIVVLFKTSNRPNAKSKIKVFKNDNIDYIISSDKLVGIPTKAEILEIGMGESFIEKYKNLI